MKKYTTILTALAILISLVSCTQKKTGQDNSEESAQANKILVAYFSATGTTQKVANELGNIFDATVFEIEPVEPYTTEDLDWRDSTSRSTIEMKKDTSIRPQIKNKVPDIAQYDIILLGYPIWWYVAPTIINTFIEENNLKGKTVYCFATSGGSPIAPCVEKLKTQYPDIKWKEGKLLNNPTTAELEDWKKEILN